MLLWASVLPTSAQSLYSEFLVDSMGVVTIQDHKLGFLDGKMEVRARKLTRDTGESISSLAVFYGDFSQGRISPDQGTALLYIDADELPQILELFQKLATMVKTEKPEIDTSITFKTRDGLMVGGKYYGKWKFLLAVDENQVFASGSGDIERFRDFVEQAMGKLGI